jgi:3-hydroxyisobutyrate dehydrogenase
MSVTDKSATASDADARSCRLAFLGLGIMGAAMSANLAAAGSSVRGWNRTPGRSGAKTAEAAGVVISSSIKEAVEQADIIFVCVNEVSDLEQVVLGADGVSAHAKPGAVVVDMGTSGPAAAIRVAGALKVSGLKFLDAPVTGGDVGARNGTLTIMVGGDGADFEFVKPYFERIGKRIILCGPTGSGQGVKLCNQILCAVNLIGVCEALKLADQLGLKRDLVVDVCGTGAGGSWSLANLGAKIAAEDFEPAFMIKLILKDINLIDETISESGLELPGTDLAKCLFEKAVEVSGVNGDLQGTQAMFRAYLER